MLWTSWTTIVPLLLVVCAFPAWWSTEPKAFILLNCFVAIACVVLYWALALDLTDWSPSNFYMTAIAHINLDHFVEDNANMLLTGAAVVWLLRRAWQTLWKPVPELISILGVDVPDGPDVMLAGIGVDKATVNWARPPANKPVQKFLIQVNGVVVGESPANQETAITVTGLKPNHFYNVRVIAVGANNFQAGSRVIRLRTFAQDGRPQLGNSRLPPNFEPDDQPFPTPDHGDENGASRSPVPAIETAAVPDTGPPLVREPSAAGSLPRRNTIGRRHSPSTSSMDQRPVRKDSTSEQEVRELGEKFSSLRKESEDTILLIAKEEEDHKRLMDELEQEKQRKKTEQKKKEEQTEKLKKELGMAERAMRSALQKKAQKEKELKARQADRSRYHDDIAKWQKQIDEWRREQREFIEQRKVIELERKTKLQELREGKETLQQECSMLEAELKEKREQVKQLEDERKKLPGGDDDTEWRERDLERKRDWQQRQLEWNKRFYEEAKRSKYLDANINALQSQLQQIPQAASLAFYNQANSSGVDFDAALQNPLKRRSNHSNSLSNVVISPAPRYATLDPLPQPPGFNAGRPPPGFAQGPFMDLSAETADRPGEDEIRALTAGAPLSPSATALVPSTIFDDELPPSPTDNLDRQNPLAPTQTASPERDSQSPVSGRSMSILSSPRGSTQNLSRPQFSGDDSERRSLNSISGTFPSPISPSGHAATNKIGQLFSFQRSRAAKTLEEPPALGTLKPGQSQSFPRQAEEPDGLTSKRRISLTNWGNVFNRNSVGPDTLDTFVPPAGSSRGGFLARNIFPFGSRGMAGVLDRDAGSPRPASIASIASSEMIRPSTDSGSIWAPAESAFPKSRMVWSPENTIWSRNPSRRPSIHGSPSALKTTLASADDEILDKEALNNPQVSPSTVGVIGTRPTKKALAKALNPAAPSFMGSFFRPKEKDKESGKDKGKGKEKSRDKAKGPVSTPERAHHASGPESAERSDPRLSRDGQSVHTQTSISESHESLSLDYSFSNTPSEPTATSIGTASIKDAQDNVVRKLFRKGSSSKFSFSSRLGKKGPGSTTNSDKNMSAERTSIGGSFEDLGEDSLGKSYDSMTSSPSLGPSRSKDGRMSGRWFSMKKKGKEKESLEMDRDKMLDAEAANEE